MKPDTGPIARSFPNSLPLVPPRKKPGKGSKQSWKNAFGIPITMNPIDGVFQSRRTRGTKVFIPFIPAGDPDLETTTLLARALANHGAGLLEIGFPYSDPIADGAVIQ